MALDYILLIIVAIGLVFWLLHFFRINPRLFSKENLKNSFFSMGILALILIVFVALFVLWLRS